VARLDPAVRTLGVVSLLNDVGSEMVYPLLPSFVVGVLGASPTALGAIEGVAESSASIFKFLFGSLSDRFRARKPFILAGYLVSALSRPLLGLARSGTGVVFLRLLDRGGKGIRAAPRDALVAQVTEPGRRGLAFGYQRAMDDVGAVLGPLGAAGAIALALPPARIFLLAGIPGLVVVLVVMGLLRERPGEERETAAPRGGDGPLAGGLVPYLVVVGLFTLGNSSDTFLLLRAREAGLSPFHVPLLWAFHNLVRAVFTAPLGALSDRLGRKPSIVMGWAAYALTYAAFATDRVSILLVFGLYALHYAFTDGPALALVSDLTGGRRGGRAFGLYHGVTGAMLLPASLLTGWLWTRWGAPVALFTGAGLAGLASLGLLLLVPIPEKAPKD
jgi:MFS family permease